MISAPVSWLKSSTREAEGTPPSGADGAHTSSGVSKKIVPRLYQQELFEAALKENVSSLFADCIA